MAKPRSNSSLYDSWLDYVEYEHAIYTGADRTTLKEPRYQAAFCNVKHFGSELYSWRTVVSNYCDGVIYMWEKTYSSSTSRQQRHAYSEILRRDKLSSVPVIKVWYPHLPHDNDNIDIKLATLATHTEKVTKPRLRKTTRMAGIAEAQHTLQDAEHYARLIGKTEYLHNHYMYKNCMQVLNSEAALVLMAESVLTQNTGDYNYEIAPI